jgi:hypothetical protein
MFEIVIFNDACYDHFEKFEKLYFQIFQAVAKANRKLRLLLDIEQVVTTVPLPIAIRVVNLIMQTRSLARGRLQTVTVITQSAAGATVLGIVFGMVSPSAPICVYKDAVQAREFFESTSVPEKIKVYYC